MSASAARDVAYRCLHKIETFRSYSNLVLQTQFSRNPSLSPRDRSFITELVFGCLRWQKSLDYLLDRFIEGDPSRVSPLVRVLLRMGIYQLIFMGRVPPRAAVNETVQLSKKYGGVRSSSFVNGLLRTVDRNRSGISFEDEGIRVPGEKVFGKDDSIRLAIRYSHPEWMVKRYLDRFGLDRTRQILKGNNRVAPTVFRINTLKAAPTEFLDRFRRWLDRKDRREKKETPHRVVPFPQIPEAVRVVPSIPLADSEFARNGEIYIQDFSTILGVALAGEDPGREILDLCAGRGGKSTLFAQRTRDRSRVVAVDRSKKELAGLRSNTKRMGIQHVYPLCADISEGVPVKRTFQTVFLDSPCSGLGTVRRHPEAKWIKGEEIVARVAGVQSDLLQAAAEKTAPGGHLLYSVCSFEPEETGDRIRGFLERNPDFQIDPLNGMMKGMEELETEEGFYRAFPGQREMDGYFVARLVRR